MGFGSVKRQAMWAEFWLALYLDVSNEEKKLGLVQLPVASLCLCACPPSYSSCCIYLG